MPSQIDETKPIEGGPTTASVRANFSTAKAEISTLQDLTVGGPFLPLAGGHLTGAVYLAGDPTDGRMPATKDYVDVHGGGSGGGGIAEAPADGTLYGRRNGAWVPSLPLAGGTLTGPLDVGGNGIVYTAWPGHRIGFEWTGTAMRMRVDGADSGLIPIGDQYLPLAGGAMTGLLTLSAAPTADLHAATKLYVDTGLAATAPLASPLFSGIPTAPTAPVGTTTAQLATCGFVSNGFLPLAGGTLAGALNVTGNLSLGGVVFAAHAGTYTRIYNGAGTSAALALGGPGDPGNYHQNTSHVFRNLAANVDYMTVGSSGITVNGSANVTVAAGAYGLFQAAVTGARTWAWGTFPDAHFYLVDQTLSGTARLVVRTDGSCSNTTGTWAAISDARAKRDVADYPSGLAEVLRLRPVRYQYNGELGTVDDGATHYGLIAQEVEPVMPELVGEITTTRPSDPTTYTVKTVDPGRAIYALINAVHELAARLTAVESPP